MIMNFEFPQLRQILTQSFQDLSDKDYQIREWPDQNFKHAFWDSLRFPYQELFDSLAILDLKEDCIGTFISDKKELNIIINSLNLIGNAIDKIGIEQPDSAYIDSPLWDKVIEASKEAYKIIDENNQKVGFDVNDPFKTEK